MQNIRCFLAFTGAPVDVSVPTSSNGQYTVDGLVRVLHSKAGGSPFRIDVITDGSASYGPARGLAPDEALPAPGDAARLFAVFGRKYLDRFPPPAIKTAEEIASHHAAQVAVHLALLAPLTQHLQASRQELDRAAACVTTIHADLNEGAPLLPEAMHRLSTTHLVSDPSCTLASRVGDIGPLVADGQQEMTRVAEGIARSSERFVALERTITAERDSLPEPASRPSQGNWEAMVRLLEGRLDFLNRNLKQTERVRLEVGKLLQSAKAVRDGVLLKLAMVRSLPDAHAAAIELAKRRLTFNKAATRVRSMLTLEHTEICEKTAEFISKYGSRFPTNVLPGIATKPALPTFDDPVADLIRMNMSDLDEDPASELLVRLGLTAEGPAAAAAAAADTGSSGEVESLRRGLAAAESQTKASQERTVDLQNTIGMLNQQLEEIRADHSRLSSEHSMLKEAQQTQQREASDASRLRAKAESALADTMSELDAARAEVQRVKDDGGEARRHAEGHRAAAEALERQVASLTAKNESLAREIGQLTATASASSFAKEAAESQLSERSRVQAEMLDQMRNELQSVVAERDALKKSVGELEAQLVECDKAATSVRTQYDQVAERVHELTGLLAERSGEVETSREAAKAKGEALEAARQEAVRRLERSEADNEILMATSMQLRERIAVLEEAVGATAATPRGTAAGSSSSTTGAAAAVDDREDADTHTSSSGLFAPDAFDIAAAVELHTSAAGALDSDALCSTVFESLKLALRPLKFTIEPDSGLLHRRNLVAVSANKTVRFVSDRGPGFQPARDAAEAQGHVFGHIVQLQRFNAPSEFVATVEFQKSPLKSAPPSQTAV